VSFIASQALARSQNQHGFGDGVNVDDSGDANAMAALECQARAPQGFVPASGGPEGGNIPQSAKPDITANPDALNIDLGED
jgi:pre-mRNA-splicing factor SYF1